MTIDGCQRTRTNEAYRLRAAKYAFKLSDDDRAVLFGVVRGEIPETGKFPPGWKTAAEELGRFLYAIDADDDDAAEHMRVVVQARRDGVAWRRIRSHFRSLRLGDRCGSATALSVELARTVAFYRSRFPATSSAAVVEAAKRLVAALSDDADAGDE